MTNEQILKKAIEKAMKNGWRLGDAPRMDDAEWVASHVGDRDIIFTHDFAKAMFPDEYETTTHIKCFGKKTCQSHDLGLFDGYPPKYCYECGAEMIEVDVKQKTTRDWQFHLQQMVISEDPIKYIGQFLN